MLTDFFCLYTYEFWLSLCKIVRSSVILLLPLFIWDVVFKISLRTSHLFSLWLAGYIRKLHLPGYISPRNNSIYYMTSDNVFSDWLTSLVTFFDKTLYSTSSLSVDPSATRRTTLSKCAAICINSGKFYINFRIQEFKFSILQEFKWPLDYIDNHHRLYVLYMYCATADIIFHNHSLYTMYLYKLHKRYSVVPWTRFEQTFTVNTNCSFPFLPFITMVLSSYMYVTLVYIYVEHPWFIRISQFKR